MMKYFVYIAVFLFSTNLSSQALDEEIGFMYTKAKYLISTDRGEDAIKVLNKIIAKNKDYEDALLLRAEAKFELGAYAGVRKDLNEYMSSNGISARVARLYGLADFQGGKSKAALNSLNLAMLEIKDDRLLLETRAALLEKEGKLLQACKDYRSAAKLGSSKSKKRADRLCGKEEIEETKKPSDTKDQNSTEGNETNSDTDHKQDHKQKDDTKESSTNKTDIKKVIIKKDTDKVEPTTKEDDDDDDDDVKEEEEVDTIEEQENASDAEDLEDLEDDSVNEIKVDNDLTLLISGEGLGSREIMNQPNILIISDQSGSVSIDVCVSRGGRVTSATFDNINSTIKKQSLVSLAVRKAKEFWFDAGIGNDKCGKIVFEISTGS